jgi:hypothetical protein
MVRACVSAAGYGHGEVVHLDNPRVEDETDHYFNPSNEGFTRLGLKPHGLEYALVESMCKYVEERKDHVDRKSLRPRVDWRDLGAKR